MAERFIFPDKTYNEIKFGEDVKFLSEIKNFIKVFLYREANYDPTLLKVLPDVESDPKKV